MMERGHANGSRFDPANQLGHYESWFARANHPSRPLAFWIRYTIFAPRGRPDRARGERWAIVFDGERDEIVAAKEDVDITRCRFAAHGLDVRIGDARLVEEELRGEVRSGERRIAWDLRCSGGDRPLLLLPERLYAGRFPKAKALVGRPGCRYDGTIEAGPRTLEIDGWMGSQNHNWGTRHTDRYAWAQVAGFDDEPNAFLECSTVRLRLGPVWSPWLTVVVLRLGDEEIAIHDPLRAARARAHFEGFVWTFETRRGEQRLRGRIEAAPQQFVGLRYANPPGGDKICLNSKLASCTLEVRRPGHAPLVLRTQHRAAYELLGDEARGIPVVAA